MYGWKDWRKQINDRDWEEERQTNKIKSAGEITIKVEYTHAQNKHTENIVKKLIHELNVTKALA